MRGHLPTDVRDRIDNLVRIGQPPRPTTVEGSVMGVTDLLRVPREAADSDPPGAGHAQAVVPEQDADIAAVLPTT